MIATIPTKVSELENDSGYLTDVEAISIEELNEITGGE
jgi:bacteriocin-like protein